MNEQCIEVEIFLEASDYRRILHWYHRTSLVVNGILLSIFLLLPAVAFVLLITMGRFSQSQKMSIPVLFIPSLFIGSILGLREFGIWKQSKAISEVAEPTKYTFDETGLSSVAPSSTSHIIWDKYVRVCETRSDFIFFPMKKGFFPFPKRFFKDPEDFTALRQLISAKLGKKAKLLEY